MHATYAIQIALSASMTTMIAIAHLVCACVLAAGGRGEREGSCGTTREGDRKNKR